jgi:hypothetical protein
MADTCSFRFVDDELNRKLIDLATASGIPHQVGPDGTLHYSAGEREGHRGACDPPDPLRGLSPVASAELRAGVERPLPAVHETQPAALLGERIDGETSFLIPRDLDPHQWNLEATTAARAR